MLTLFTTQVGCSTEAKKREEPALDRQPKASIELFFCQSTDTKGPDEIFTYSFINSTGEPFHLPWNKNTPSPIQPEAFGEELEIRMGISLGIKAQSSLKYDLTPNTQTSKIERRNSEGSSSIYSAVFNRVSNRLETSYSAKTPNFEGTYTSNAKCTNANYPFRANLDINEPYSKSGPFASFLSSHHDWGTGTKATFPSLGKCKDIAEPSSRKRRFTCSEGFVQLTSPMGVKVCEIKKATYDIHTKTFGDDFRKSRTTRVSLGECRWKS